VRDGDAVTKAGEIVGGQYELVALLGGGVSGQVYRARAADREVALKLLHPGAARLEALHERFEREARALNGLEHPHVIRILDFGLHQGAPYLVTELVAGKPLDRLLAERPLPAALGFELGLGIVAGLSYAHRHGVLHRDLKPSNVFVAELPDGSLHPKLLDFGLARFVDSERWGKHHTVTEEGAVLGTPAYMAPEQGYGGRADARSDVYSAGVVLFELLAARAPFAYTDRTQLIRAHLAEPPPKLGDVRRDLDVQPALEALLARALAKKPEARFDDAGLLLRAMQDVPDPPARIRR
jgi:serine/threonine-protein kinase